MIKRRDFLVTLAAVICGAISPSELFAQAKDFPNRPIRMIVPFAAGGGVDVFARLVAEKLRELRGYNIVVDNRSGANGTSSCRAQT